MIPPVVFRPLSLVAAFTIAASGKASACAIAWSARPADAFQSARDDGRLTIIAFTGSDWSLQSVKLDQDVLMNVEFTDFARMHFSLANADFPQRRQPSTEEWLQENISMGTRHRIEKWPTLLAIRPDGTEFARIEYAGETASGLLRRLQAWQQDYQAETAGDKSASAP